MISLIMKYGSLLNNQFSYGRFFFWGGAHLEFPKGMTLEFSQKVLGDSEGKAPLVGDPEGNTFLVGPLFLWWGPLKNTFKKNKHLLVVRYGFSFKMFFLKMFLIYVHINPIQSLEVLTFDCFSK